MRSACATVGLRKSTEERSPPKVKSGAELRVENCWSWMGVSVRVCRPPKGITGRIIVHRWADIVAMRTYRVLMGAVRSWCRNADSCELAQLRRLAFARRLKSHKDPRGAKAAELITPIGL